MNDGIQCWEGDGTLPPEMLVLLKEIEDLKRAHQDELLDTKVELESRAWQITNLNDDLGDKRSEIAELTDELNLHRHRSTHAYAEDLLELLDLSKNQQPLLALGTMIANLLNDARALDVEALAGEIRHGLNPAVLNQVIGELQGHHNWGITANCVTTSFSAGGMGNVRIV